MIQYTRRTFSIFAVLLILTNNLFAQNEQIKQIDSLIKSSHEIGIFNGNILVAKNNKIIYNASFGFTDGTKMNKLSTDYRFNIGSITKEFSAVALMQLKEQGKLTLNDKVSKFIPELPKWANEVSIKDLLQYTSGIPNVNWKNIKNDKDLFDGLMDVDSLDFKPGTAYDYNNNNLFLRQFIVERVTKMPFKVYVEKFIFKPCQMTSSVMTPFENEGKIAKGFNNNLVPDKPDLPITGGTYLTTIDLLKWANCIYQNKIISKKSLYELGQHFDLPETQSALGETKFKNENLIEHLHDGRAGNYEAILVSDMNEKFTVILLDNNYNGKVFEISDAIISILKNQKYSFPKRTID
ncbi:serine hydrolase domain-containing protein [Chryseobacterium sp. 3008163]|uniref:serine hydrolase domain-containing protein n=1 Tax=Chryseobacterium sp. 3008163 TaxID=2478663 RepID=UPI000F0CF48E|nr:serine hydrolase domain-containing protein [Chryseobacterium sp. 3008163]AYN02441.1 class A beta-lactamase-related serine hydrolase [Chryseobacterium sp. 3008163]